MGKEAEIVQHGYCHPAGTLVRMADGSHKPIESVALFDEVVTAEGHVGGVSALIGHRHSGDMLTIRLRGHRVGLTCTLKHRILTAEGYMRAEQVEPGMSILCPARCVLPATATLPMETIVPRARWQTLKRTYPAMRGPAVMVAISAPPETITLDYEMGYLVGLYAAEGYAKGTAVSRWAFSAKERDTHVAECCRLIRKKLGAEPRIQIRPNNVIIVALDGRHWVDFFAAVCGKGAGEKALRLDGPEPYLRSVFDGWIAGDGYERRSERQGVTISSTLAFDMFGLASDLRMSPTIKEYEGRPSTGVRRRRHRYDVIVPNGGGSNAGPKRVGAATARKVAEVVRSDFVGFVYGLAVEDGRSFVANGIGSHDCGLQQGNRTPKKAPEAAVTPEEAPTLDIDSMETE